MSPKETIYKLLRLALIEIRHEAQNGGDVKNIAALSDLFHNIPSALAADDVNYEGLLDDLEAKVAGNAGLTRWLSHNRK
jgi:hypothetical protein